MQTLPLTHNYKTRILCLLYVGKDDLHVGLG